jgi:hypothetical protein
MRNFALLFGTILALVAFATPAVADQYDDYFEATVTNATAGVENLLTAPLAPFIFAFVGDDEFDLPLEEVSSRVVGLVTGTVAGVFTLVTGAVDLVFAPVAGPIGIPSVSPEPIIDLF